MKRRNAILLLLLLTFPMLYIGNVSAPAVGFSDNGILHEQWHYDMQALYTTLMFGSSSCVVDLGVNSVGGEPNADLEIIIGSDEYANNYPELGGAYAQGIWRVLDSQGNLEWAKNTGTDEARSSPTVADLDGNGYLEIIGGTTSGWNVEVMDRFGNWVWTFPWPPTMGGPFAWHSSPAVADVDPSVDGLEVFIGNNPYMDVWALDGDNADGLDDGITATDPWIYGGVEGIDWDVLWKFTTGGIVYSSPALGDVDNDGITEVVIGSGDGTTYILDGISGALEWSYPTAGPVHASAAIANLDGDPYLEMIMGSGDGNIYCLEWNGTTGSTQWTYSTGGAVYSSAAIGDIDGDGALEIVDASTDGNIYALDASGSMEWTYSTGSSTVSSPALADRASVTPYDREWPMFRHNRERTGLYGPSPGPQGLDVYIGADDHYLYLIEGGGGGGAGGTLIDRFLTYGRLYTSPSVADIDGDSALEIVLYDAEPGRYDGVQNRNEYTYWCIEDKLPRTLNKRIHKKVKMIPAPVQFWREFIGGVTDIIVFDPPEIIEPVALVREYTVLHEGVEPYPLELLTWENMDGLPWEPIDTPEDPYILAPDEIVEYDIPTLETDTAVLVRYTVAWASTPDTIEAHFINEAILESRSPQVIVGQLSNFDVHNDYDEPVDNFELELYGIQPSDIIDWFPGWGAPPEIYAMPPSGSLPAGTEIIWVDPENPIQPCNWEHFGLHLKPGVIAAGVKAYWTQTPSAELGDVIHVKIDVTVPFGETATVVDTLPTELSYLVGTFTVDGVPATPTITKSNPPPPIVTEVSYTLTTPGTHLIEFDCRVDTAYWEDRGRCNVAVATWYNAASEIVDTMEDIECFTIHPFEQLHKNVGIPKADVVFAIDLTGSMLDEIDEVKANATYIMNNLAAQIADVQFGLITYMDYDGTYSTTAPGSVPLTYTALYGSAASGDYPYQLDQDITGNTAVMAAKIAGLVNGWGADGPQDYTRILHESWNDSNLHWRTDAKRILILFGDNVPHDTNFDYDDDGTLENTGGDPGRDTILGTADDLDFEAEVANAATAGVHVMAVYSGSHSTRYPWTYMAAETGGGYFELEEAEQIPDAIQELIKEQAEETLTIKEETDVQWAVVIDIVNPFSFTMKNVTITDNFGAEIEIDSVMTSPDTNHDGIINVIDLTRVALNFGTFAIEEQDAWDPTADLNNDGFVDMRDLSVVARNLGLTLWTTGKSDKVHLYWYIGNLAPGETARIIILVSTDLNPAGHQEYTEPGIYEMNSGATLKFQDCTGTQLSAVTDSIYVTVLPQEDP